MYYKRNVKYRSSTLYIEQFAIKTIYIVLLLYVPFASDEKAGWIGDGNPGIVGEIIEMSLKGPFSLPDPARF